MIVIHNSNYYQKTFGYLTNKQISANLKLQQQHVRLNLILFKENIIAEGLLLLRCLFRVFFFIDDFSCRCGIIVCQRHSLNRLPLFASVESIERWYRVCDGCFYDLIINKKQVSNHDSAADFTEIC